MSLYYYVFPGALIFALAAFFLSRRRRKPEKNPAPNICIGAIRVTREGRNMLIVRKEDGSFEMLEEESVRKKCLDEGGLPE
jgi:hypothetical protein